MQSAYARAAKEQVHAREADTVGIILLGLPVSSLAGENVAAEVARPKGEIDAVKKVWNTKRCEDLNSGAA
ncbi:MAG: hypothetical protein AAFQ42_08245 [Pseudomonadota bacterium]